MQLNQNKTVAMLALLNLDSQSLIGSPSPLRSFGGLNKVLSLIQGLKFVGVSGATEASTKALAKESNRVAYEMKRTLGIKGFILNLTSSAALGTGLPACWDAVRPCLETPELEDAAGRILAEASSLAEGLGKTNHKSSLHLTQAEATHLQEGLDFYHFVLPKMLVLTSALRLACQGELLKRGVTKGNATQKNAAGQDGLQNLFQNIRRILSIPTTPGSCQMPEAWAKYLLAASAELKPLVQGENFNRASNQLHQRSCELAPRFSRSGQRDGDGKSSGHCQTGEQFGNPSPLAHHEHQLDGALISGPATCSPLPSAGLRKSRPKPCQKRFHTRMPHGRPSRKQHV